MQELPIACTLSGDDLAARTRDLAALAGRALRSRTAIEGGDVVVDVTGPPAARPVSAELFA